MKKLIALVLVLLCALGLAGCANNSFAELGKATKIEIVHHDKSNGEKIAAIDVTEKTSINFIVENLNSLKFKKMEYNEPTVLEYTLIFYDSNGETIETVLLPAHNWVGFNGYFHSVTSGVLDRAYIAGLFE